MHHLRLEALARLVDEEPDGEESAHLACCEQCANELDALQLQSRQLGELTDPPVPAALWDRLEMELRSEGLVAAPSRSFASPWPVRIAAGFVLFILGGAAGTFGIAPALQEPIAAAPPAVDSVEGAEAALVAAEAEYLQALSTYAGLAAPEPVLDPLNRLAALEGIVLTTRAALRQAPADPVINNYHLTAIGQRDALLRQIENVDSQEDDWY